MLYLLGLKVSLKNIQKCSFMVAVHILVLICTPVEYWIRYTKLGVPTISEKHLLCQTCNLTHYMQLLMQGKQIGMGSIFFWDLQKFWCRHLGMLYMESQAEHGAELGQKFSQCD